MPRAQVINTELPKLFISEEPKGKGGRLTPAIFGEGGLWIEPCSPESILLTDLFWDLLPE